MFVKTVFYLFTDTGSSTTLILNK